MWWLILPASLIHALVASLPPTSYTLATSSPLGSEPRTLDPRTEILLGSEPRTLNPRPYTFDPGP